MDECQHCGSLFSNPEKTVGFTQSNKSLMRHLVRCKTEDAEGRAFYLEHRRWINLKRQAARRKKKKNEQTKLP